MENDAAAYRPPFVSRRSSQAINHLGRSFRLATVQRCLMPVEVEMWSIRENDRGRRHARHQLRLAVEGSVQGRALLHNMSDTGVLLETTDDLALGEVVHIDLPGASGELAKVVWREGSMVGCQFDRPISRATISASRLQSFAEPGEIHPSLPDQTAVMHTEHGAIDISGRRFSLRMRAMILLGLGIASWAILGLVVL